MKIDARKWLKNKLPDRYWPVFSAIDKYWVDLLYLGYLCQRICYEIRCRKHITSKVFPQFEFQCGIGLHFSGELADLLKKNDIEFSQGRHSIYINQKGTQCVCERIAAFYPHPCGLKIIKSKERSPDGTVYYTSAKLAPASNSVTMRAVGSLLEKAILSNLLNIHGVAPRVYDLAKIRIGNDRYQAMVVQDISGPIVRGECGVEFIKKLRNILKIYGIKTLGKGDHKDFRPPDFRSNIVSDNGNLFYVDIQNFVLFNCRRTIRLRHKFLRANAAQDGYGKIPAGKSQLQVRKRTADGLETFNLESIDTILDRHQISYKGACIADTGCRRGRLLVHVLEKMAAWYLGITCTADNQRLKESLYIQGATRFDLIPCGDSKAIVKHPMAKRGADILILRAAEHTPCLPPWIRKFAFRYMLYIGSKEEGLDILFKRIKSEPGLKVMESGLLRERDNRKIPIILAAR